MSGSDQFPFHFHSFPFIPIITSLLHLDHHALPQDHDAPVSLCTALGSPCAAPRSPYAAPGSWYAAKISHIPSPMPFLCHSCACKLHKYLQTVRGANQSSSLISPCCLRCVVHCSRVAISLISPCCLSPTGIPTSGSTLRVSY